ncbi:hypothetical protein [Mucilaginibacter aquatilis]|uniref:Uncharacterized protein n=1 Tax=Mucilaginibacter aquatilis TaxID=1517760 RepID=A0A6I4IQH6_9SPHI|nr:hypothetical protein [Mucilaginibacter aquatilis]MVN91154.1 hypothetical protein [Mucilaginibacter aquatilis]
MSNQSSIWAVAAANEIAHSKEEVLYERTIEDFGFKLQNHGNSLWIVVTNNSGIRIGFRTAFSVTDFTGVDIDTDNDNTLKINCSAVSGDYIIEVEWPSADETILHYKVEFKPAEDIVVPFWPRDIVITGKNGSISDTEGDVYISQTGTRSGLVYAGVTKPEGLSFLYLQNLTSLGAYNIDTETSAGNVVGGQWPELGLSLPPATEKPMKAQQVYTLSDAYVCFSDKTPNDQFEVAKGFMNSLAQLYLLLPRPDTEYHNYLDILNSALHDLQTNKGCWSHRSGHPYLNAYVSDYNTPPEIMVQLAVLLPVTEYIKWSERDCSIEQDIKQGLPSFYNDELKTVMRWLPTEEHMLDESEEQKVPMVMDSWYLHHPLLNLARLASEGDEEAKDLLLKSVDFAIKVAHHFKYEWPVFYRMDTLETVKEEAKPGEGGEKDVAGLYAHVMLQVWEITGDKKYFQEAENAAKTMTRYGFDIFYQANNTMFAAKAMVLLYRETKKELYLNLSYLFLANIFKNVALWECTYGYGKHFPSFFELFPLSDAPYTAVYEEQEAYAGVHEYLSYANGVDVLPSVKLLLAEFVRYIVNRAIYYYPPMLPKEMLADEVKTGELDPNLWIALEDIHDGWEKSGSVGQEVYGAGLAFGIIPRQYTRLPNQHFMVFIDYPVAEKKISKNKVAFKVLGSSVLSCRLCIVHDGDEPLPVFKIESVSNGQKSVVECLKSSKKRLEYVVNGESDIVIKWS